MPSLLEGIVKIRRKGTEKGASRPHSLYLFTGRPDKKEPPEGGSDL
jgi:hypothetical protein